eukprot:2012471-Alexandrium_andersonii.AAC.1
MFAISGALGARLDTGMLACAPYSYQFSVTLASWSAVLPALRTLWQRHVVGLCASPRAFLGPGDRVD